MSNWRSGNDIGSLYMVQTEHDLGRVGGGWMHGRVRIGDILLCVEHSGDCFNQYILVEYGVNFIRGIPNSEFGAYALGTKINYSLSAADFFRLRAGDSIKIADYSFGQAVGGLYGKDTSQGMRHILSNLVVELGMQNSIGSYRVDAVHRNAKGEPTAYDVEFIFSGSNSAKRLYEKLKEQGTVVDPPQPAEDIIESPFSTSEPTWHVKFRYELR